MRHLKRRLFVAGALVSACAWSAARLIPPPTRIDNVTDTLHGIKIADPYRWLEDQKSPETRAWIDAQAKFARAYLDPLPGRAEIRAKLAALMKVDVLSAPIARGGKYFFTRRLASEARASICMREALNGRDEVLVAPESISSDQNVSISIVGISDDGSILAYGVRFGGEDENDVRLLDVGTRKLLPDGLPRGRYFGFDIKPDKSGFYYSRFVEKQGSRVYYHAMGSPAASDREIFGKGYGPDQIVQENLSEDGRYLILSVSLGVPPKKVEIYVQDVAAGEPPRTIVNDVEADFRPDFGGNYLYLQTNWKAPNWRILRVDPKHPERDKWKEVVPESKQPIDSFSLAGGRLFAGYLENVTTRIRQFDPEGKPLGDLKLPGIGTAVTPSGRWQDDEAFYTFSSFTDPSTTWRISVSSGKEELWFRPKVPIRPEDFQVEQVWYESKDKTKIPMFLVYRKGLVRDGAHPTMLYGYGGFTVSLTPQFSPAAATWVSLGGVYALANLRGGGEFGEIWHRAGMFEKKQNVFDDFFAAAEWLVANRYTNPARLVIRGGSNGGLLVGAALTQRPDLFNTALCGAPLLDMLRYQKFKVGSWWAAEYGSADDAKQFEYLFKYSPYHHVRKGIKYPAVMFVTGDSDTRVDPLHARKMAGLLQASTASDNPILLRYEVEGGHTGSGSVDKLIDQTLDEISFAAARTGLTK
jgi:prolyl oligopeptidase